MVNELVFLFSADADIQSAFELHENNGAGRGELFLRKLDDALSQLRAFPESGPRYCKEHRRLRVSGSPYGIFYRVIGRRIILAHLLDLRQDPEVIRRKLG
jgi:plasmid stabilization system protein ParE